jgi:polysaccharide biosynthesis/export protein ExoF
LPSRRTRSLDRLRFAATTGVALALAAGGTADAAGSFDGTYRGAGRSPDPSQRRDRATPAIQLDHRQVLPATSDLQFRKGYTVRKRFFAAGLLLLMCGRLASAQSPNDHPPPPTADVIAVGDKLKLSFYEPLAADKWSEGRNGQPGPSFYLRAEFSGEYVVAPDWSVTVPVIGRVMAAHRTAEDVANDLTNHFDKLIGHAGSVTATIVSHLPIYVVGPVKTPGAYPFSPGLTPLSAVALAGGVLNQEPDRWALVEAMQMAGKHASSVERLQRVLAQYAVLRAELDGKPVTVPDQLVRLVGEQRARDLAATEAAHRAPVLAAQADRAHGFQSAIDTAEQAISIDQSRLAPLQESINARQVRTDALLSLMKGGNSDRTVVLQAQSELVNVQDRRAEVLTSIAADQNRLANARIDAAKFASDTKAELEQKVTDLQREIDTLSPEVSADAGVMQLLQPSDPSSGDDLRFEIVRGSDVLSADITTRLDPGDVVRVMSLHPTAVGSTTDSRRGYIASRTGD